MAQSARKMLTLASFSLQLVGLYTLDPTFVCCGGPGFCVTKLSGNEWDENESQFRALQRAPLHHEAGNLFSLYESLPYYLRFALSPQRVSVNFTEGQSGV